MSGTAYVDPAAPPTTQPAVAEIGTTSAPLKSAAFFIGAHCKDYNDDFMLCKAEGRKPEHCLKEGRRVTRCTADILTKLRENCATEFESHWKCLELRNQEYYRCRKPERTLNECVFTRIGLKKVIPGTPAGQTPIHEVESPIHVNVQK